MGSPIQASGASRPSFPHSCLRVFLVFWLWSSSVSEVGHCFVFLSAPTSQALPVCTGPSLPLGAQRPPQGLTLATFIGPIIFFPHAPCQPHQMLPQLNQCLLEGPGGVRGRAVSWIQPPSNPLLWPPPLPPLQPQCHLSPLVLLATHSQ